MNRITQYWPSYYDDVLEFHEIAKTESIELDEMQRTLQQLLDDQFVMTSRERAVKRREQMLNIQADPSAESLDFRKKRIINRYSTKPPFTAGYLQERLDFLVGPGRAMTSIDVQRFVVSVTAAVTDASVFKEIEYTVKTTKPANMVYRQETALEDAFAFEERISMQTLTRETKLSTSWRLGATPFATVGPEVEIK